VDCCINCIEKQDGYIENKICVNNFVKNKKVNNFLLTFM
jgi:hypothetical protein